MIDIDPAKDDFYRKVIEQRVSHKKENKALADFLKVLANSESYGLFVEVNTETTKKGKKVGYFSGEKKGRPETTYRENPGAWYFPPLASLITSGGRLLLASGEIDQKKEGRYLFCDTDSLCIVGTEEGGIAPCEGVTFSLRRKPSNQSTSAGPKSKFIAEQVQETEPIRLSLVPQILKIEDVNYVDRDPKKSFRQLFGYAVSAKRYALYSQSGNEICIEKASGHGLGYLFAPKRNQTRTG